MTNVFDCDDNKTPEEKAVTGICTWIGERIEQAAKKPEGWNDTLQKWGLCLYEKHCKSFIDHFEEPPIPMGLVMVFQAAINHEEVKLNKKPDSDLALFRAGLAKAILSMPNQVPDDDAKKECWLKNKDLAGFNTPIHTMSDLEKLLRF